MSSLRCSKRFKHSHEHPNGPPRAFVFFRVLRTRRYVSKRGSCFRIMHALWVDLRVSTQPRQGLIRRVWGYVADHILGVLVNAYSLICLPFPICLTWCWRYLGVQIDTEYVWNKLTTTIIGVSSIEVWAPTKYQQIWEKHTRNAYMFFEDQNFINSH